MVNVSMVKTTSHVCVTPGILVISARLKSTSVNQIPVSSEDNARISLMDINACVSQELLVQTVRLMLTNATVTHAEMVLDVLMASIGKLLILVL